ncbi:MAG: relaxase/mobilization nuclease domain-containing protein [Eubacterium sp.]
MNVKYNPCKSVAQLKAAEKYMLGIMPEQIRNGIVKTADNLYSALGCNRDNFANSILVTRKLNGKSYSRIKDKTILAHKLSISFHPDDNISYEDAAKIAEEFADKFMSSQGFEVLYAVHTDTDHVHVHFLISNCNVDTGKCFHRNRKMLYDMSEFFGQQCMDHGFIHSVRDKFYNDNLDTAKDKLTFAEHQMRKKGKETFKDELREVIQIEIADPENKTFDDVIAALMKHYNVESRVAGNTVSYRHPEYKDKNGKLIAVRGSRLGDLYTRKGIEYELNKKQERQLTGAERESARETGAKQRTDLSERAAYGGIAVNPESGTNMETNSIDAGRKSTEGRKRIPARDVSNADRTNVPDFDDLYGRYAKRHSEPDRNAAEVSRSRKRVHRKSWERD